MMMDSRLTLSWTIGRIFSAFRSVTRTRNTSFVSRLMSPNSHCYCSIRPTWFSFLNRLSSVSTAMPGLSIPNAAYQNFHPPQSTLICMVTPVSNYTVVQVQLSAHRPNDIHFFFAQLYAKRGFCTRRTSYSNRVGLSGNIPWSADPLDVGAKVGLHWCSLRHTC
jgi:hypothetical protein